MHYAEFGESEVRPSKRVEPFPVPPNNTPIQSAALLAAIKDYEASKWKVIGQKLGKPAKVSHPVSARIGHAITCTHTRKHASGLTGLLFTGLRTICEGAFPEPEMTRALA